MMFRQGILTLVLSTWLHFAMSSGWERVRLRVETIQNMPPSHQTISTHILNTSLGQGAANVTVTLYRLEANNQWTQLNQSATNAEGRISNLVAPADFQPGTYKLHFDTKNYFNLQNTKTFYPFVEIVFECATVEHYHVPLLLNPYGYSTYRGT